MTPSLSLILLGLLACNGGPVEFPAGLEPLEDNTASWPEGDGWPEEISLVVDANDEYTWVHARAYIHQPVSEVWAAYQVEEILVNRRSVVSWEAEYGVEPEYDFSVVFHNVVEDIVTVEFDVTWRQGVVAGDADAPEIVAARYQKTDGTPFIELLEGSVTIRASEEEGVTELEIIEHMIAAQDPAEDMEESVTDRYAEVQAWIAGDALPTYEETE